MALNQNYGRYVAPGIYINEINNSVITLPIQDFLINLVPGFSRKGVFNKPVYVDNKTDFEKIFGSIDRRMESKGSYFHRTVNKMLESGPVWALSLLKTDDSRDLLNYKSISVSSGYENGIIKSAPYSRFFNRQDFWEKDTEAFMSIIQNPTPDTSRLLHLTNMGDKVITVFMFKSSIKGFDITAENWYGGVDKVPVYLQPKSWISDYMVSVVILNGDWTKYDELSVDTTWSKYFNQQGLIKTTVSQFLNERNVNVLGFYDASLIPNFKDVNNKDMYIKNLINNDSDFTGLFCTYNEDLLLESDYPTDVLDIIGDSLVDSDINYIDFLSYKTTISEDIDYTEKYLDSENNTFSSNNTLDNTVGNRTNKWTNWSTYGINATTTSGGTGVETTGTTSINGGTYVINGVEYTLDSINYVMDGLGVTESNSATTFTGRYDLYYLTSTGSGVLKGQQAVSPILPSYTINNENSIILGYSKTYWSGTTGLIVDNFTPTTVDGIDYVPYTTVNTTGSTSEYNYIQITFVGTSGTTLTRNYNQLRGIKTFNELSSKIELGKAVICEIDTMNKTKYKISNYTIFDKTSTSDAYITIFFNSATTVSNFIGGSDEILIYYTDNEFLFNGETNNMITNNNVVVGNSTSVSEYSSFYQNFKDGIIQNGDYFFVGNDTGSTKVYIKPYLNNLGEINVKLSSDPTTIEPIIVDWSTMSGNIKVYSRKGNWEQTVEIEDIVGTDYTKITEFYIDKNRYPEIKKGSFISAYYNKSDYEPGGDKYGQTPKKLCRITNTKNYALNPDWKIIYTDAPIMLNDAVDSDLNTTSNEYYTTSYSTIEEYVSEYVGVPLTPFVIHVDSMPNNTESRQSDILDVIDINTNLAKGLVNKNKITWRYLVDSFGLGLTANSKQQLVDICGKKLNCLGFINMPSAKQFKNSVNPSFIDENYALSTEFIKEGGDLDKNPDFLYSFGTGVGQSCVGYFFPYVKDFDTEINTRVVVPPAAHAATSYMKKFILNQAGLTPWTVVAGITNGRVLGIAGTEMDFTEDDLVNLQIMGANAITFIANNGYVINSENTAEVFPVSSLSFLHSREVLIELENKLYDMLLIYQWKFNTATTRSEIKYRADKICKDLLDQGALYDFRNICDETNNTNDIIDSQKGILDTRVEIIKAMGIIINNITIERTGAISSSGFAG